MVKLPEMTWPGVVSLLVICATLFFMSWQAPLIVALAAWVLLTIYKEK